VGDGETHLGPEFELRANQLDQLTQSRALETIAISVDLKARALPAIDAWIREHSGRRP